MAGGLGQRTLLAPARHAGKDQFRVARQAGVRANTEFLADTGTKRVDEDIGVFHHTQQRIDTRGLLEVEYHGLLAAGTHILHHQVTGPGGPVDTNDFRAHIGQHHAAHGRGPDTRQLDDGITVQWPHSRLLG